ncbi:hypothetical protein J6590_098733 [Homalodisca vitripennis]|nr:hypothetical protein J6590_098733 [Homalodisca vitripennis]
MYYCIVAVHADASLTEVGERQMPMCLFVARSALSLALQALNGTPQSEERRMSHVFGACSRLHRIIRRCYVKTKWVLSLTTVFSRRRRNDKAVRTSDQPAWHVAAAPVSAAPICREICKKQSRRRLIASGNN